MKTGARENESFELDETDVEILRSLNDNARKSFRDIAKELHISLTTVSNRVKMLEKAGIIQGYIPVLDPGKLGYDITAIIGIKVIHGRIVETERDLAKDPSVYAVFDSTGDWDAIIMARFRNREDLNDFVKRALDHENVDKTYTQVVLNITKDERRVRV
ncbi:MAG: Lrp/AsnC family transcriptional regulator [Methanobacteriota archaeon]|nr:MAG: Lrp/AsnC family transcriptional regulator [Euryarchaeota archaeon]